MRQKPNRVVEDNGAGGPPHKYIEVYSAHDQGDWRNCTFELPAGLSEASTEKAALWAGKAWVDKLEKMGFELNRQSIQPLAGPFPCLELDKLDMVWYRWKARFRKVKPDLVNADRARELLDNQPTQNPDPVFIARQVAHAPELIEANARTQAEAAKNVPATLAAHKEVAKFRRDKGLPPFKEETVLEEYGLNEDRE